MEILDVIQRSPEWLKAKHAMLTSTRIAAATSFRKDGSESDKRFGMKLEILQELITGEAFEHYVSPAMEFGIDNEALARTEYELRTGNDVELIGFVLHPTIARGGCSPDGLIKKRRFVEFKVPNTKTHLEYLAAGIVPAEYTPQLHWQMCCAEEIEANEFVSFDPRLPEELQMFIAPLERDEKKIAYYNEQAEIFLEEVVQLFEKIKRNAKYQSIEDKLRASIRMAKGKFPFGKADLVNEVVP